MNKRLLKIILATLFSGIGLIYVLLSPNFNPHPPNYDSYAKQSLKAFLTTCKIFWAKTDSADTCNLNIAAGKGYDFKPIDGVTLKGSGNEATFAATAWHNKSPFRFLIDSKGAIHKIKIKQ